jgi:hypothetical protein
MTNSWHLLLVAYLVVILTGLLYTWDFAFTFIAVGIATLALIFLGFFMFCMCGWAVGPWEVILMVVFLHHFVEPAFRVGRGAVWAHIMTVEMRISGNVNTPREVRNAWKAQQKPELPQVPALPDIETPAALEDGANPPDNDAIVPAPINSDVNQERPLALEDQSSPPALNAGAQAPRPNDMLSIVSQASDNTSECTDFDAHNARSEFEGRLRQFTLNIANTCFASALKLMFCSFFLMFANFRIFARLGVVTFVLEIILLPCTFILLPSAILLCPTREEPDILILYRWIHKKIKEKLENMD